MSDKYFVVDTNVIVSVAVFSSHNPALALKKVISSGQLAFSEPILQEYAEILSSKKFDKYISIEKRLAFLQRLTELGKVISIKKEIHICRDPKDDKYLDLALACGALCIVTGDKDLLVLHPFEGILILTPLGFLTQNVAEE